MADPKELNPETIARTVKRIKVVTDSLIFEPRTPAVFSKRPIPDTMKVFSQKNGHWFFALDAYEDLVNRLRNRHSNIAQVTVEKIVHKHIVQLIDKFAEGQDRDWQSSFAIKELGVDLADDNRLQQVAKGILDDLPKMVRDFIVFVPLAGVELEMPEFVFGSMIKLVRPSESLPIREKNEEFVNLT